MRRDTLAWCCTAPPRQPRKCKRHQYFAGVTSGRSTATATGDGGGGIVSMPRPASHASTTTNHQPQQLTTKPPIVHQNRQPPLSTNHQTLTTNTHRQPPTTDHDRPSRSHSSGFSLVARVVSARPPPRAASHSSSPKPARRYTSNMHTCVRVLLLQLH